MKRILVVANETVAGRPLIDAVKRRAGDDDDVRVHVICPQNEPKHGFVVHDEHIRDAAQNRLEMTLALLREAGIEATGEIMDPDPYSAVMDALGEQDYDEIVVSTHPETRSGWLRQGLVDRLARATRRDVEHVVVDLDSERDDVKRTLVVANQTVGGQALLDALKREGGRGAAALHRDLPGVRATGTRMAATPTSDSPTRSRSCKTRASRPSARSSTPIPTRRSRTRCSSTGPTTSSSRPSRRRAPAGCAPT